MCGSVGALGLQQCLVLALLGFVCLPPLGSAQPEVGATAQQGPKDLLQEVTDALGGSDSEVYRSAAELDLPKLEASLGQTVAALPRNSFGRLGPMAVRYALHRLFTREYGWRVEGLDPEGAAWNSTSLSDVVVLHRMPSVVRRVILQRLEGQGLHPHEVAVLAATIKHLIHGEAAARLRAAYRMLRLPRKPTAEEELQAVDLYMGSYILGRNIATTPPHQMLGLFGDIEKFYPEWKKTQSFVRGVLAEHRHEAAGGVHLALGLAEVEDAVREIGEKYGRWQDSECRALKDQLLRMEYRDSGRVRLADFYGKALGGGWQFSESVPYLRQLGALDDSNPSNPRVIIPNYISSMSNCIGASGYHSLCCISECEELMGHIERGLEAPDAAPEDVAALVAALPSASVPANRSLPTLLLQRLQRIAASHGGRVPIYGRLFAQWMHHAYPRECPYPHLAGSTRPKSIYELERIDPLPMATNSEMRQHAAAPLRKTAPVESTPWVHEEEIFVAVDAVSAARPPAYAAVHGATALAACVTVLYGLSRMAWSGARRWLSVGVGFARKPLPSAELVFV